MITDQQSSETGLITGSGESETTDETPAVGSLIPQAHGGALRYGGTNAGGPGVPKSSIREECRKAFRESIPNIARIAKGRPTNPENPLSVVTASEVVRAIDVLGKYGLGEAKVLVPDELKSLFVEVLISCDYLTGEQHDDICKRLDTAISSL